MILVAEMIQHQPLSVPDNERSMRAYGHKCE